MKTFSQVISKKEETDLFYIIDHLDDTQIDEKLFNTILKSVFGKYAKVFNAAVKGLEADRCERWKTFSDEYLNGDKNKMEKELREKDPEKAIGHIETMFKKALKNGDVKEEDEWTFKAYVAYAMYSEHKGDSEYKKTISEYIEDCKKKGGKETQKDLSNLGTNLKGNEQQSSDDTAPTEEEVKADSQSTDKAAKTLGGSADKVKDALDPIIKTESSVSSEDVMLESKKSIKEIIGNDTIYKFRQTYLYGKNLSQKEREVNRKVVIDFVAALSAMKENIKKASSEEIKEFVMQLMQYEKLNKSIFS